MKINYLEEIERHRAFTNHMRCPYCGCGRYEIHHILTPADKECFYVECPACGIMGESALARYDALDYWKQGRYE